MIHKTDKTTAHIKFILLFKLKCWCNSISPTFTVQQD